jgi:hypothetical protein
VRRIVVAVILAVVAAGLFVGHASADVRCCKPVKPPTSTPGLPYTGLPLYIPVLLSLGGIGTGVALRRRSRPEL